MIVDVTFNGVDSENENAEVIFGENGATFTPSVSSEGVLSWTNDRGLTNPPSVNIKGSDGASGADGHGVPAGGTANQILKKVSATDYDTAWVDAPEFSMASLTFGNKTYDGSQAQEITASDLGALTEHQQIYQLVIQKNGATIDTFNPTDSAQTVNISNVAAEDEVVHLAGLESISGKKTFTNGIIISNGTASVEITIDANGRLLINGTVVSTGDMIAGQTL